MPALWNGHSAFPSANRTPFFLAGSRTAAPNKRRTFYGQDCPGDRLQGCWRGGVNRTRTTCPSYKWCPFRESGETVGPCRLCRVSYRLSCLAFGSFPCALSVAFDWALLACLGLRGVCARSCMESADQIWSRDYSVDSRPRKEKVHRKNHSIRHSPDLQMLEVQSPDPIKGIALLSLWGAIQIVIEPGLPTTAFFRCGQGECSKSSCAKLEPLEQPSFGLPT